MTALRHLTPDPRHRRWAADEDRLLGKFPDKIVALRTKHPLRSVSARRRRFNLTDPSHRPYWTSKEDSLLGTRPDAEVARKVQRTVSGVHNRRIKLKIPAWVQH